MYGRFRAWWIAAALVLAPAAAWIASGQSEDDNRDLSAPFVNASGFARTFSTAGRIDTDNPFFRSLGTNGRACVTCHQPSTGWTLSAAEVQRRFAATDGLDPLFRTNDGSDSPLADVSTVEARRAAYGMLLSKGLIRVGIGIMEADEFTLEYADDPYGYASAKELSLFRRPLPATNLKFLSAVMFDGRETFPGQSIEFDLMQQANDATLGHAQAASALTDEQRSQIVAFETALFTAQVWDAAAGDLSAKNAAGGPKALSGQPFYLGINDSLGGNPSGVPFTPVVFTDYDAWGNLPDNPDNGDDGRNAARAAIARGQRLFDGKRIEIEDVKGLNDALGMKTIHGTCGTCHDTPNVGNHSFAVPLDIGLTDASRRTPDMPLYALKRKGSDEVAWTTDPGRALISGKWKDIGKFKGPILRGLAARAPYFHNGSAATLADVVRFYDTRFNIGFTEDEIADLAAFLRAQ